MNVATICIAAALWKILSTSYASGDFPKVKIPAMIKDQEVWIVLGSDVPDGVDNPKVVIFSISRTVKAMMALAKEGAKLEARNSLRKNGYILITTINPPLSQMLLKLEC